MSEADKAGQIHQRFLQEHDTIDDYVRFMSAKTFVSNHKISEINRHLVGNQVEPLKIRREGKKVERSAILDAIVHCNKEIDQRLAEEYPIFEGQSEPLPPELIPYTGLLEEWTDYLSVNFVQEFPKETKLPTSVLCARDTACDLDDAPPKEILYKIVDIAFVWARGNVASMRADRLESVQRSLDELAMMLRLSAPEAEINLYRQGFILLMTAFDAAVFDLTRVAMHKRFFSVIKTFGGGDKISYDTLANAGNHEELQSQIIESQLKKRYVKDIIAILIQLGVTIIPTGLAFTIGHLYEAIQRRNLHVHNRGYVDERYLECDDKGQSKYNVYQLKLGEYATIDKAYLGQVSEMSRLCIDNIQQWAATL